MLKALRKAFIDGLIDEKSGFFLHAMDTFKTWVQKPYPVWDQTAALLNLDLISLSRLCIEAIDPSIFRFTKEIRPFASI